MYYPKVNETQAVTWSSPFPETSTSIFLALPLDSLLPMLTKQPLSILQERFLSWSHPLITMTLKGYYYLWHCSSGPADTTPRMAEGRGAGPAQERGSNWEIHCRIIFLRHTGWCESISEQYVRGINPGKETLSQNSEPTFNFGPYPAKETGFLYP